MNEETAETEGDDNGSEKFECRKCGRTYEFDGERITCYGTKANPHKGDPVVVVRPCGICGDPITAAEICNECGEQTDGDAFTTNWG
jgi:DNA-directed RNA polymerase subunit M/transcription elongation factor TFIIS